MVYIVEYPNIMVLRAPANCSCIQPAAGFVVSHCRNVRVSVLSGSKCTHGTTCSFVVVTAALPQPVCSIYCCRSSTNYVCLTPRFPVYFCLIFSENTTTHTDLPSSPVLCFVYTSRAKTHYPTVHRKLK